MAFVSWILVGALVGWVGTIIMGRVERKDYMTNIPIGIAGAILGGLIMGMGGNYGIAGFDWTTYFAGAVGAGLLLATVFAVQKR